MTPSNTQTQTPSKQSQTQSREYAGMLRSLKEMEGYKISGTEGDLGTVHDLFFDDEFWSIRYIVVDTGRWLPGRKVLLPPSVLRNPNWLERSFTVELTREQVKASPDIDTDKPVSRQREIELHNYYGWPFYWVGAGAWPRMETPAAPAFQKQTGDPHLRSVREVTGYDIEASDGDIGGVDDFVADDASWIVRYLVAATSKWLPGRKVLIAPQWLVGPISWSERKVKVILSREEVRNSPEFDPAAPVNREYEARLYDYYGRPRYWA